MASPAAPLEWARLAVELIKVVVAVATTLGTAGWIVYTWRKQRQIELDRAAQDHEKAAQDRARTQEERRRQAHEVKQRYAALYVYPFLFACEELQSRIWNILCHDGLAALRRRYPSGGYEADVIYLLLQYLGWERVMYRYGPYTHDSDLIALTQAVRGILARDPAGNRPSDDAFWLVRTEQRALAQLIMRRTRGEFGSEFETMPFHSFQRLMSAAPLSKSPAIAQSLAALKEAADDAGNLKGRDRLAQIQHVLVQMLATFEAKEGVRLFPGERRLACGCSTVTSPCRLRR
jgi:hypothetical protein